MATSECPNPWGGFIYRRRCDRSHDIMMAASWQRLHSEHARRVYLHLPTLGGCTLAGPWPELTDCVHHVCCPRLSSHVQPLPLCCGPRCWRNRRHTAPVGTVAQCWRFVGEACLLASRIPRSHRRWNVRQFRSYSQTNSRAERCVQTALELRICWVSQLFYFGFSYHLYFWVFKQGINLYTCFYFWVFWCVHTRCADSAS